MSLPSIAILDAVVSIVGGNSLGNDEPIAFFITWTVYGTFLQGDDRGWRQRRKGEQLPSRALVEWHRDRLRHSVLLLSEESRSVVEAEIDRHCTRRGWKLWARAARINHVHVLITAVGFAGSKVRDQLKANATRGLRECSPEFRDRPVWTKLGDWKCVNAECDLEKLIIYVDEAQDRMHLPKF